MKIKNHRKREWVFSPCDDSKLPVKVFKYKSDLMRFLTGNLADAVNGQVVLREDCFGSSYSLRQWFVWYNHKAYCSGAELKAELKQLDFRGHKYISRKSKIEKVNKKYFALSDKVIRLMCTIDGYHGEIPPNVAQKLTNLFYKRGFKDFEPSEEDWRYINGHIEDGIDFFHWSDRCDWLRTKTIIEYFKRKGLRAKN